MAEDQVDVLAAMHGRFYGDPTLAERFRWLADYPRWFTIGAQKMQTEHYTQKALDAAAHLMPAKLMHRREEVWPATMKATVIRTIHSVGVRATFRRGLSGWLSWGSSRWVR